MAKKKPEKKAKEPTSSTRSRQAANAPSTKTIKRLFAVSGNRCAFQNCPTAMVDSQGTVLGEVCHIKGDKPGAKRYDANQTAEERQGFDNLILMCSNHHKKIDDDDTTFTVESLIKVKADHEAKQQPVVATEQIADQFIDKLVLNSVVHGSAVTSQGQTGGQTAHSIQNIYNNPPSMGNDELRLEGKLRPHGTEELLQRFGGAGLELLVINRGQRTAKISGAQLCVEGVGFIAALRQGYENRLGKHDPPPGLEQETLWASFSPLSAKNHPEGFSLDRDDVCRFFLPLGQYIGAALSANAEDVYCRVNLLDESKMTILRGEDVQRNVRGAFEMYRDWPRSKGVELRMGVEVLSQSQPTADHSLMGALNSKPIWFAPPPKQEGEGPPPEIRIDCEFGIAKMKGQSQWTISLDVIGLPEPANQHLQAVLFLTDKEGHSHGLLFQRARPSAGEQRAAFMMPTKHANDVLDAVKKIGPERYWLSLIIADQEYMRLEGKDIDSAFDALDRQIQAGATPIAPPSPPQTPQSGQSTTPCGASPQPSLNAGDSPPPAA